VHWGFLGWIEGPSAVRLPWSRGEGRGSVVAFVILHWIYLWVLFYSSVVPVLDAGTNVSTPKHRPSTPVDRSDVVQTLQFRGPTVIGIDLQLETALPIRE
jgi:hypothetical protein